MCKFLLNIKKAILVLLILFCTQNTSAQFGERNAIYFTGDTGFGNYIGFDYNLNYVYKEKYSFKIGYSGNFRESRSKPADYSSDFLGILFGTLSPYSMFDNYQIGVGRVYKFNKKGTIRANLSVGIGYTKVYEAGKWQRISNGRFFRTNYTWDYQIYNTVSLIISPKIEFPFSRHYGLSVAPVLHINKDATYFGISFGQMIGLLRKSNR